MDVRQRFRNLTVIKGAPKGMTQRLAALFLLSIFLTSIMAPPVSAYVGSRPEVDNPHIKQLDPNIANKPMKQDYAGPLNTQGAAQASQNAHELLNPIKPMGEALPSVGDDRKVKTGEIVEQRTANSTFTRNADNTVTEERHFQPIHFKKNNKWEKIDTTLIEDKNASDSTNPFGRALGQVQSWMSSAADFQVKDNDWQARFSPSSFDLGMVRVKKGNDQIGFVPIGAKDVAPVITSDNKGRQTVHYYDLWPGVNVEYEVTGGMVKENIVLKDKTATSRVQFRVVGAELTKKGGGFSIKGAFEDKFSVTPLNLMLTGRGPVTDTSVFGQSYEDGVLTIAVDESYLQKLPASAFPAVIDPGIDTTNGLPASGGDYKAIGNDNTVCGYASTPQCKIYTGGYYNGYDWSYFRSVYYAPYTRFQNNNYRLVVAKLHMHMQTGSGWHGTTADQQMVAGRATCNNNFTCFDINSPTGTGTVGSTGDIDLTNLYKTAIAAGDYGMWLMVMGAEEEWEETFKEFDPAYTTVSFTWGDAPPAPPILSPSTAGQVFTDPQVSFRIAGVSNPNNSTPLQYEMRVSTSPNGGGTVISSGLQSSTQWTIPDGMLQDGSTYYVQARSYDPTGSGYGDWSSSVEFKIDMRTGKDKTQTYDTLGPVDVNLATGNVATSAGSHASAALGGSLGISLDYNSPERTRQGLSAQYWNNTTMAGQPLIERVDANVDFEWAQSSPSAGMSNDNFSAKWKGYFVAPTTGAYYFGANNDDSFTVKVDNQTIYTSTGCPTSVCYGANTVSLTAGQIVEIELTYVELTGNAFTKLWAKGAVSEGAVPPTWLRTAPRPITQSQGLTGRYYFDNGNHDISTAPMFMERNDPWLNFLWEYSSPVANGPNDNFLARWTGYFTAPVAGTYEFGAYSDDGVRITVGTGNTQVLNHWQDQQATTRWGSGYALTANQSVPITVDYFEHTGGATMAFKVKGAVPEQTVPSAWLSPKAKVLPDGWNLGLDPDGNLSYDHAKINPNSVVLTDSTGSTHEYTFKDGGYKPPVNEDGYLVRNVDGTLALQDVDGRTYVFGADGTLKSVTSPVDDRKPAALRYEYQSTNGGPARITQITDGVDSSRWSKIYYSGQTQCGSAPSGFDASAPANMLCAVETNDGRSTYFYYKNQLLARIAEPGSELTDYEYDAGKRIVSIRDVLANDAIAAGVRADDAEATTQLAYDILGRVSSVKQPSATAGATRIEHTIEYLPGVTGSYAGATQQHIIGATEPNGFSRRVEYDHILRTTRDTDVVNLSTVSEWEPNKDLLFSTTDPAGLKSTTIYDDDDRPTDSYGPAPTTYYGADRKPTTTYVNQVPRTETKYDEGISGPAVSWHNTRLVNDGTANKPILVGAPKLHATGITPSNPTWMARDFTTNPAPITVDAGNDNIGFSATGKIVFPGTGTYTFKYWHDDGARLYIDDKSLFPDADWWHLGETQIVSQGTFNAVAGKVYRFRLDFVNRNTHLANEAWLSGPGITDSGNGHGINSWGSFIRPGYNLTTSTKVYDGTLGNSTSTTNYGANPELGLAQSSSIDPTGLNLTTTNNYETQGATGSFLRQTSKTLPGGGTTNYEHYGESDTKDNPCTTGTTEAYRQGGFMKLKTEADPDGAGSQTGRKTETIYDDSGKVVATRYNTENWTCTTYDTRGRISQTIVLAYNGNAAHNIQNDYAVGGSPLLTTTWDGNGWIVTWADLLGRTIKYRDVYDDETTTTYDSLGRLTGRSGPLGNEAFVYDSYNRLVEQKLDSVTYATVAYDQYGRMDHVDYNNAGQMRMTLGRDGLGRTSTMTYRMGDGTTTVSDTANRTQSGQTLENIVQSGANQLWYTYGYDGADRLVSADIGPHSYDYGFGVQHSSCGVGNGTNPNSGKNSNRTTQTINGATTTFCYDYADRLTSSSDALYNSPTYDSHGNMTQIGTGTSPLTLGYDSSDRSWGYEQLNSGGTGTGLYYDRDVQGRIIARYKNTITNWNWAGSGNWYYHYTGSGDTPDYIRDGNWDIVEKTLQLPGGVNVTVKPLESQANNQKQYSLPNNHGDTLLTANAAGANTSTGNGPLNAFTYDPFGNILQGSTLPANTVGGSYGYVGQHEKVTESAFTLAPISMGARIYLSGIGRFASVDPIEGGTENNYVYPTDPVNEFDLTGMAAAGGVDIRLNTPVSRWIDRHPNVAKTRDAIGFFMGVRRGGKTQSLPDGRMRMYGSFKPAKKSGEMAGGRKVKEVNPRNGKSRSWYEILDHNGRVRSVRPFDKKQYRHYIFDKNGKYQLKR